MKDERLAFMMKPWSGAGDPMTDVLAQFLGGRYSGANRRLVRSAKRGGRDCERRDSSNSFSLKVWQTADERAMSPVLLVCEEAHRYVPNSGEAQYGAAQAAIRRIAKEGRKYGIGLMLVSQRPSEVEATVLSQCNSWIVLRITNEADREHVKGILPDSMAGLTKMLSDFVGRRPFLLGRRPCCHPES